MKPDFIGWATKNNLKCGDGRTIMKDAFIENDGMSVPLVWHHQYGDPANVLGHALLKNCEDGVQAYGYFNDTESGKLAKQLVQHKDITQLSIYANQLVHANGKNVIHGKIREVSLVPAGANPGAMITDVIMHGEDTVYLGEDEGVLTTNEFINVDVEDLSHADDPDDKKKESEMEDKKKETQDSNSDPSVEELKKEYEAMSDKQKEVVHYIAGMAVEMTNNKDDEDEEGDTKMKHNAFENSGRSDSFLIHAEDQAAILERAKQGSCGSFKEAFAEYMEEQNALRHNDDPEPYVAPAGGFVQTGDGNITNLFPEYKEVRPGAPELITDDQGWIGKVMAGVHKSPISRIRTSAVDIRNVEGSMDALRAKGYKKGHQKALTGNFKLLRRTTDPQTVYVKNAIHRDDIVDITDFDYVQYLYNIDRMMLNEEIATAIMLGDGREDGEDKIYPDKIRPIWLDDELYTIHRDLDIAGTTEELQGTDTNANFGTNFIYAEAMVNAVLYAREKYKGTGQPSMYITPHMVNVMLLARDRNGRRIYGNVNELAAAFNVKEIITAEQFAGKTRETADSKTKQLVALIVNLQDYHVGATKGGEITHFTQFDIDFNQQKSLIETRISGALTRVYSAIAIEEDITEQG